MEAEGALFLVPVPIGNPDDLTLRAIDTLRSVDLVAAEDTRDFGVLARRYEIATPSMSYHDHNERERGPELLRRLKAGQSVAVVTDAGTPLISDPGFRLVNDAIAAGVRIVSLPGASAVTTAVAGSGMPPLPFRFCGFPPRTSSARRAWWAGLRHDDATLVCFEAPHRLRGSLADALRELGNRAACLARNLTKPHERFERGSLAALLDAIEREGDVRGEVTLVIAGNPGGAHDAAAGRAEEAARLLLGEGVPARVVTELLVAVHRLRRRAAYDLVLRMRDEEGGR